MKANVCYCGYAIRLDEAGPKGTRWVHTLTDMAACFLGDGSRSRNLDVAAPAPRVGASR
jgi:hypothetical protein